MQKRLFHLLHSYIQMQFVRIHIRRVHCQREGGTSEPAQVETHKAIMFCVFLHINFVYLLHSEESSCLCVHLKRMSLVQTEEPDADTEVSIQSASVSCRTETKEKAFLRAKSSHIFFRVIFPPLFKKTKELLIL